MYTIAYRLHDDGHIEPFTVTDPKAPQAPFFTVEDIDGFWVVIGHRDGIPHDLCSSTDQVIAEQIGQRWLLKHSQP